jgi:hypothetical protein
MSEQKPLPCPFCEGAVYVCKNDCRKQGGDLFWTIQHVDRNARCFAFGRAFDSEAEALEMWQATRARPQAAAGLSIYLCRQHGGIGFTSDCRECRAPQAAATEAATGEAEKLQSEIYRLGRTATVMDFNVDPIRDAIAAALTAADLAGYERGLREAAQVVKAEPELEGDPPLSVMHAIQRQGPVPVLRAAVASTKRNIAAAILAKLKGDPQ